MRRISTLLLSLLAFLTACRDGSASHETSFDLLTVSSDQYEIRGKTYQSKQELVVGLRDLQPKPVRVAMRWVMAASDSPASTQALSAKIAEAQVAMREAGVSLVGTVGNEVFWPSASSAPLPAKVQ